MTAAADPEAGVDRDVLDAVREDPSLAPEEKETVVRFAKPDDEAVIHTREAALTRRLLAHPDSSVVFLNVVEDDGTAHAIAPEAWAGEQVTGAELRVPVGVLKVRASSRRTAGHATIISESTLNGGDSR